MSDVTDLDQHRPSPADMPGARRVVPVMAFTDDVGARILQLDTHDAVWIQGLAQGFDGTPSGSPAVGATHELRCWPGYFTRVWSGEKPFEVRWDDRGYQAGDHVVLREWDRDGHCPSACLTDGHPADRCPRYSGRRIDARIGYVMAGMPGRNSRPGFEGHGYVVFSLLDLLRTDTTAQTTGADQ